MRHTLVALLLLLITTSALAQSTLEPAQTNSSEKLGLRGGYVATTSDLDETFGAGLNLALHFIQGIGEPFSIDFTLGAFYLGSAGNSDLLNQIFVSPPDDVSMQVIMLTLAPMIDFRMNDRTQLYVSGGIGMYTVSEVIDSGFFTGERSNTHFGLNGGVGTLRQLTTNWFLDLNAQVHKFWTGTDFDDLFYVYSDRDEDPLFYSINVGVMLRLF